MQLLRLGLVNYTTIGQTFQKIHKDNHVIAALIVDGCEALLCIISTLTSLKLGYDAKHNRFKSKHKDGAFFVQIIGEKEIVVVRSKANLEANKLNIAAAHSKLSSVKRGPNDLVSQQQQV